MQECEVLRIVCDEDGSPAGREEQVVVVRRFFATEGTGTIRMLSGAPDEDCYTKGDVMVDVAVGHAASSEGSAVGGEAFVDDGPVSLVEGEGRLDGSARNFVIRWDLVDVAAERLKLADDGPDRDRGADQASRRRTGPPGRRFDVASDQLVPGQLCRQARHLPSLNTV